MNVSHTKKEKETKTKNKNVCKNEKKCLPIISYRRSFVFLGLHLWDTSLSADGRHVDYCSVRLTISCSSLGREELAQMHHGRCSPRRSPRPYGSVASRPLCGLALPELRAAHNVHVVVYKEPRTTFSNDTASCHCRRTVYHISVIMWSNQLLFVTCNVKGLLIKSNK